MKRYIQILIIIIFSNGIGQTIKAEIKTAYNSTDKKENVVLQKTTPKSEYKIIIKTKSVPGYIDTTEIRKLNEPLKALTAFYAAMGGTMCDGENCKLTTALGLGKQGSHKHKALIKIYFPNDKVAETLLKQNCYLRPSGASTFSDFQYLTIIDFGDTIKVDYNLMYYNHGDIEWTEGPDIYLFKDNVFIKSKRNLWKHLDK